MYLIAIIIQMNKHTVYILSSIEQIHNGQVL